MPRNKRAERKHGKELKRLTARRGIAKRERGEGFKGKIFRSSTGGASPKMWLTSSRRGVAQKAKARAR